MKETVQDNTEQRKGCATQKLNTKAHGKSTHNNYNENSDATTANVYWINRQERGCIAAEWDRGKLCEPGCFPVEAVDYLRRGLRTRRTARTSARTAASASISDFVRSLLRRRKLLPTRAANTRKRACARDKCSFPLHLHFLKLAPIIRN